MGLVSGILRRWTEEKSQTEADQLAAERVELDTFVDAEISGRSLTKQEQAAFAAMLDRESLDETTFKSAVEAKRALIAAEKEVAECIEARHTVRELTLAHQQELDARKIEDARRLKSDQEHAAAIHVPRHKMGQLDEARRRLRNALPPGQQTEITEGRATIRGTQAAVNALHRKVIEAVELVDQLQEPAAPMAPLSRTERLLTEYRQQLQLREQTLLEQQKQRDDLAGMRQRLDALQETLKQQQAAQDELERKLLKA